MKHMCTLYTVYSVRATFTKFNKYKNHSWGICSSNRQTKIFNKLVIYGSRVGMCEFVNISHDRNESIRPWITTPLATSWAFHSVIQTHFLLLFFLIILFNDELDGMRNHLLIFIYTLSQWIIGLNLENTKRFTWEFEEL